MQKLGILKSSFAMYAVLVFVLVFATISLMSVETKLINSQLDYDKYAYLQGKIHIDSIVDYIQKKHKAPTSLNFTNYQADVWTKDNKTFDIIISHDISYINIHKQIKLP